MMELEKIDIENYEASEDETRLAELLTDMRGNISATARAVQRSWRAIYHKIEKSPYLKAVVEEARETILDEAESVLFEAVKRGDAWAVCFVLKTIGKNRGFSERMNVDVKAYPKSVAELVMEVAKEEEERKRLNGDSWDSEFEN